MTVWREQRLTLHKGGFDDFSVIKHSKVRLHIVLSLLALPITACDHSHSESTSESQIRQENSPTPARAYAAANPGVGFVWTYRPTKGDATPSAVYGPADGEAEIEIACNTADQSISITTSEIGDERPTNRFQTIRSGDAAATVRVATEQDHYGDDFMWRSSSSVSVEHPVVAALAQSFDPISFAIAGARNPSIISTADAVRRTVAECITASRRPTWAAPEKR